MALQLRRGTNAERLLITPQQGELIFVTDYLAVNITATTIASNLITFSANHNLVAGQKLLYIGVTANGLTQNTVYYVLATDLSVNACKLSTTLNGTVLTLTNATGLTVLFNKAPTNATGTPVGNVSPLWIGNGTTVGGVSAQVSVLNDLLDVDLTSLAEGQTLYFDNSTQQWRNTSILKIDDTSNSTNIEVTGSSTSVITVNDSVTVSPVAPLILRHTSSGTVGQGFGTTIGFEAEAIDGTTKTIGYLDFASTDTNNNYQFGIGVMKDGVAPSPTLLRPLQVDSLGNTQITGNLTLNRELESGTDSYITFGNPTKNGVLAWNSSGTGLFINGNFDVNNGANSTVNITAGNNGSNAIAIANLYNQNNIGTINIGNGVSTEVNIGNPATGRTQIKSPQLDLLGDIRINGNEIKNSDGDSVITFDINDEVEFLSAIQIKGNLIRNSTGNDTISMGTGSTGLVTLSGDIKVTGNDIISSTGSTAITLENNSIVVAGDVTVMGNDIKSSTTATAITLSGSDVIVQGDILINGNDIKSSTGATVITLNNNNTIVTNDLEVSGGDITSVSGVANIFNNDGISVVNIGNGSNQVNIGNYNGTVNIKSQSLLQNDLTGVSKTFNLFNTITETLNVGGAATAVNIGATTGTTTIRNNAVVTGNLTVNGTTTTVNSTTLTVDDKNIELGSVSTPTDVTAAGGGITLRGDSNKTIVWNNSTDGWEFNQSTKTFGNIVGTNDLSVSGNASAQSATISGVLIAKNALQDNQSNYISVAKGQDLVLQSGSTMVLNSDYFRIQRNTSRATSIVSNIIGTFNGSAHNFNIGDRIQYTGNTGNGLTQNAYYYVSDVSFSSSTCRLATTSGGTPITLTSGSNLNLTFFSEGGLGNAYFNLTAGQYAFNRETPSGNYNLEVEGTFNATGNSVIGGDLQVNGGDITTTASLARLYNSPTTVYIGESATYVGIGATTGNVVIASDLTVAGGDIKSAGDTVALSLSGANVTVAGDLTVGGNDIKASDGVTAITLATTTGNVNLAGDLTVSGNDIYSSSNLALTLSGNNVVINNDLTVGGNDIKASDGTTALTLAPTTGSVTVAGDLFVVGNEIFSSGGNRNLTFSGTDVVVEGDLTVSGNTIKKSGGTDVITFSGTNLTTLAGGLVITADLDVQGGDITNSTGALQLTTVNNNHIKLTPAGTGNVYLESSTVGIGDTSGGGGQLTTNNNGSLRLDTANGASSGYIEITAGVNGNITLSPNGTGKVTVTGDLAVNGGDISTTSTSATLFNSTATAIAIGSSGSITTFAGSVVAPQITIGNSTDICVTATITQTTPYQLTTTTRRGMKMLLNITDNVTKDVHMVDVLLTAKVVSGVGTVYMTTYGEVTSAGHLATFSADYDTATSAVRFFVTPLSSNSTQIVCARKSIS